MKRLFLAVLLIPSLAGAQVIPTSEWISVWSDNTTFNMGPAPPGAVVRAYDPQGVLCGESTVATAGSFGLMPVYRDDPLTPLVDEGADPGDVITFEVDGVTALPAGPDAPTWTANGDVKKINLAYEKVIPTTEWISLWSDATTVRGVPVPAGAVVRAYDAQGALCGEYTVQVDGQYGLMAVYADDPLTAQVDEGAEPGDVISFKIDDDSANPMGPDDTVWGSSGQVKNVDLDVPAVPSLLSFAQIRLDKDAVSLTWRLAHEVDPVRMSVWRRAQTGGIWSAYGRLGGAVIERNGTGYACLDTDVKEAGLYEYRLEVNEGEKRTFMDLGGIQVPFGKFVLRQNSPNPFSAVTTIEFELPERTAVSLAVYDVQGKLVRGLINNQVFAADTYRLEWDGLSDAGVRVAVGVYFIRIETNAWNDVRKLTLVR